MKKMSHNSGISVVITTLGEGQLEHVINSLITGKLKPIEIIISIPYDLAFKVRHLVCGDIKLNTTYEYGQVLQRISGFKQCVGAYVLQIDDDILVDKNCLFVLRNSLNKENIAVAPIFLYKETNKSIYSKISKYKIINLIYYFIMNGKKGYQPGSIDEAGSAIGWAKCDGYGDRNVDWLPGGCIMHKRDNLIKYNYYPFIGKAYYEDIIHSFLLKKNKISLFINQSAIAYIFNENNKESHKDYFVRITSDYKARRYAMNTFNIKFNKLRLFLFLNFLNHIINSLKK